MQLSKAEIANLKKRGEWFTVRAMEEYRFWHAERPWSSTYLREHGLTVVSFSAKTSSATNQNSKTRFTKKRPLRLPCGFCIDSGFHGVTTQSRVATLSNIRVDSLSEMNQVLAEASKELDFTIWEIIKLEIHNVRIGPIVTFRLFNPDGTGTGLYLYCVDDGVSKRTYFEVSAYEQQALCNNIQEKIANCTLVQRMVPACGLQQYLKNKDDIKEMAEQ